MHSDESALLTTSSQALPTANSAFVTGPSSAALTPVHIAGAATSLDAKLGMLLFTQYDVIPTVDFICGS